MSNIYYDTEKLGLAQVGCLDEANLSYEFNTLLVIEEIQSGKMFWAHSSGCSCPTPFEEYSFASVNDNNLEALNKETLDTFLNVVKNFPATQEERHSLIRKVKYRLNKQ